MTLKRLNPDSYGGGSPTVWREDDVTLVVQGWCTGERPIDMPPGEDAVRLPTLLAVDAVAALDGDTIAFIDLMRMLRTFATSAFRLEARQLYVADRESLAFAAWQELGRIPSATDALISDWTGIVRARVAGGAVMRRARVVNNPLTDYVRFELSLQQAHSLPAGEQVLVVDGNAHPDLAQADDFWLLDDRVGVRLIYDDAGKLISLQRMTTGEVHMARSIRDAAWAVGTDLIEFDAVVSA